MVTFDPGELEPRPIKPNPGGQIDPGDHIGHGDQYSQIKTAIEGQGALLTGDRRMGKTSMLNVIATELRDAGHEVVRLSAETEYFGTFATRLRDQVRRDTAFGRELDNWTLEIDAEYAGIHLKRKSKTRLQRRAEQDVDDFWSWAIRRAAPKRLYVILDEITVLAHEMHLARDGGGLELLRSLKRARDMNDGAIMIFAGSIGIHHALPDNNAIGDLSTVAIGPLRSADAEFLARCLLLGADVAPHEPAVAQAVARAMVDQTGGIAYYLHHLAEAARLSGEPLSVEGAVDIIAAAIENPDDPWKFNHYEERLPRYYRDQAPLAAVVLDDIATAKESPTVDALHRQVAGRGAQFLGVTPETIRRLLELLERDHYLRRDGVATRFASELLRRAWVWKRRLS